MTVSVATSPAPAPVPLAARPPTPRSRLHWIGLSAVLILAALLWATRLSGPLDLRFDAGVYYLLGTSLAEGEGYRLPNEPGAPEAIQYPPMLPLLVTVHQWVLGTSAPEVVAPALRLTYLACFFLYAAALYALARRLTGPVLAVTATALCLLSIHTYFLSDLLFTELPFALATIAYLLLSRVPANPGTDWRREAGRYALATVAFLLRTAGVALYAAWVLEAWLQRRWRAGLLRAALALLPFAAWQAHILRVERSDAYQEPAYAYQRAPYQFYNVSYSTNLSLADPFAPEGGASSASATVRRVFRNLAAMPAAMAESTGLAAGYWRKVFGRLQYRLTGTRSVPEALGWVPVVPFALLLLGGLAVLVWRRQWPLVLVTGASVGLVCLTPWPGQFARYLSPVTGPLALAVVVGAAALWHLFRGRRGWWPQLARLGVAGLLAGTVLAQAWMARFLHLERSANGYFFHADDWHQWNEAAEWIDQHAPADAIVATAAPHQLHLRTGHRSIMPPMEADPAVADRLLRSVPVAYVIVDTFEFIDISRRYALPALAQAPEHWTVVHRIGDLAIYAAADTPAAGSEP